MSKGYASLCVLSFERPDYLKRCIEEIHERAGYPFEIIIHDDGSTNLDIQDFLLALIQDGEVSRVILNPPGYNEGVGAAIHRMFDMATGDYLFKIDQDLTFKDNFLADAVGIFEQNTALEPTAPRGPLIALLGLLHYMHHPVDTRVCLMRDYDYMQTHTHILGSAFALPDWIWDKYRTQFGHHSDAFAEDWEFMKYITDETIMCCALPPRDLCENYGMGIGPSTVVLAEGVVRKINHEPVIFS